MFFDFFMENEKKDGVKLVDKLIKESNQKQDEWKSGVFPEDYIMATGEVFQSVSDSLSNDLQKSFPDFKFSSDNGKAYDEIHHEVITKSFVFCEMECGKEYFIVSGVKHSVENAGYISVYGDLNEKNIQKLAETITKNEKLNKLNVFIDTGIFKETNKAIDIFDKASNNKSETITLRLNAKDTEWNADYSESYVVRHFKIDNVPVKVGIMHHTWGNDKENWNDPVFNLDSSNVTVAKLYKEVFTPGSEQDLAFSELIRDVFTSSVKNRAALEQIGTEGFRIGEMASRETSGAFDEIKPLRVNRRIRDLTLYVENNSAVKLLRKSYDNMVKKLKTVNLAPEEKELKKDKSLKK